MFTVNTVAVVFAKGPSVPACWASRIERDVLTLGNIFDCGLRFVISNAGATVVRILSKSCLACGVWALFTVDTVTVVLAKDPSILVC